MTKSRGFSLVELSIVLVILGLLVGGVLTGQSLIRAAELRSVTTEYQKYTTAISTFRDKYFAIPGDMANATAFWGAAHATPATCYTTTGTGTQTCNGNGDGAVSTVDGGTTYSEQHRGWQHLANAGLIEGQYTGVAGAGGINHSVIGTNAPRAKMGNAGWSLFYQPTVLPADTSYFEGNYGNSFIFGAQSTTASTNLPALKPEEQWNIDTKIDDGKPAYGVLRAFESQATCVTTTTASTAAYLLTSSSIGCTGFFVPNF